MFFKKYHEIDLELIKDAECFVGFPNVKIKKIKEETIAVWDLDEITE